MESNFDAAPSASDLMRSIGLTVDGPVLWGAAIASRKPGVFVVELPEPLAEAPLDHVALRQWLERAPAMRLDGQPVTPHGLARYLSTFWVPTERIVYIGRSNRSLGARLGGLYATALGDSKPHPGGRWLKTLSVIKRVRLWWAETDAPEEFEDALLEKFGHDSDVLPFANLSRADGASSKATELTGDLREPAARPTAAAQQDALRVENRKSASAPGKNRAPRKSIRTPVSRPAAEPEFISQEGYDKLTAELDNLRTNVRPEVIARVKAARELGDLKENADYEYARKEQSFIEGRIQTLESFMKVAVIAGNVAPTGNVALGSTVIVDVDGDRETYTLVGATESNPAVGKISIASPVGKALLGRRAGDEVTAVLPAGTITFRIVEVG